MSSPLRIFVRIFEVCRMSYNDLLIESNKTKQKHVLCVTQISTTKVIINFINVFNNIVLQKFSIILCESKKIIINFEQI